MKKIVSTVLAVINIFMFFAVTASAAASDVMQSPETGENIGKILIIAAAVVVVLLVVIAILSRHRHNGGDEE
ncbi:MAG: hypothetical protein PUE85_06635 [Firmicutes bacterium]|nr:hypothetical protein [Bacillota bacterium]